MCVVCWTWCMCELSLFTLSVQAVSLFIFINILKCTFFILHRRWNHADNLLCYINGAREGIVDIHKWMLPQLFRKLFEVSNQVEIRFLRNGNRQMISSFRFVVRWRAQRLRRSTYHFICIAIRCTHANYSRHVSVCAPILLFVTIFFRVLRKWISYSSCDSLELFIFLFSLSLKWFLRFLRNRCKKKKKRKKHNTIMPWFWINHDIVMFNCFGLAEKIKFLK